MDTRTKPVKRLSLLIRESDANHAKKVYQGSSEQQKNALLDYVRRLQDQRPDVIFEVAHYCSENRSASKNHHLRVEFENLKRLIRSRQIHGVVTLRIDRLARDEYLSHEFRKLLTDYSCELHEATSGHIDFTKRMHRFKYSLDSMIAADFSEELSEKITRNQRMALVNSGKDTASLEILGLKRHPTKSCMYEHEPREVEAIQDIVNHFINVSQNLVLTAEYANGKGYSTKKRLTRPYVDKDGNLVKEKLVGGKSFNHKILREHLTSNKLRSLRKFMDSYDQFPHLRDKNGVVSAKYAHDPVITHEQALKIDAILEENSKHSNKSDDHLLSGILFSADNETYKGTSSLKQTSTGSKKYLYYDSPTAFQNIRRINGENLHNKIIRRMKQYLKDSKLLSKILKETHNSKICDVKSEAAIQNALKALLTGFDKLSICDKKKIISSVFHRIVIHSNGTIELLLDKQLIENNGASKERRGNSITGVRLEKWRTGQESNL